MKQILIFTTVILFSNLVVGQTGPGGVGTNDGTSHLEFWYMADGERYSDGNLVSLINDRSGNGRTLTASGIERPTFDAVTPNANNFPSLIFALNQELETSYNGNSNENMSFGIALSYKNNNDLNIAIQHGGRNTLGFNSAHFPADYVGASNHTSSIQATSAWTYYSKTFANSGGNRLKYYHNLTNTDNFTHNIENRTSNTWIGGNGIGGGTGFNGNIAEVYKFSRVLNSSEQIIIANYLTAKYNIKLTVNDLYDEDDPSNGNYDFDVAGIGRINTTDLHNSSQGTGIVWILNPTKLDDNKYLFWGHDGGIQKGIEMVDVPATVQARFDRVWRVSEVDRSGAAIDVGAIDMRFDLSDLGNVTASDLRLLVDSDNDGVFNDESPISGATNVGGNIYEFSGVVAIQNNLRFTLGTINNSQTPLPIELLNFNAEPTDPNTVKLTWQTASETNNHFFTIERSKNGKDWSTISKVDGAGNSNSLLSYTLFDDHPYSGISYYRLKQTDFDARFSYSDVRSVNIDSFENSKIEIYPNPAEHQLVVIGNSHELEGVEIYNSLGQNVTHLVQINKIHNKKYVFDISDLSNGFYYLRTRTTTNKLLKQ